MPMELASAGINCSTIPVRVLGLITFCFAFSLLSLLASEPILTLAMVNRDSFPKHQFHTVKSRPTATATPSVPIQASTSLEKTLRRASVELPFASVEHVGTPAKLEMANTLLLTRDSRSSSRASFWASFQPGYGEIFGDDSAAFYGRTGTGWEEPSCGYLKIRFSF
jgi:hypothetical protein